MQLASQGVAMLADIVGPEFIQRLIVFLVHGSALFVLMQLAFYVLLIPLPSDEPITPYPLDGYFGALAYGVAYVLSLLRLPFTFIPYLSKVLFFLIVPSHYKVMWNS